MRFDFSIIPLYLINFPLHRMNLRVLSLIVFLEELENAQFNGILLETLFEKILHKLFDSEFCESLISAFVGADLG